ncbi:MAG: hypothetical protein WKG32_22715 [Gemmatimonadaceae bacterium]
MTVQQKITPFIAPANDQTLGAHFESWRPDPTLTANQMPANRDWNGLTLKPISAGSALKRWPCPSSSST